MHLRLTRRRTAVVILVAAFVLTAAALVDRSRIFRGLLLNEAFFRNRPTSYWRDVLREDAQDSKLSPELQQTFERTSLSFPVLLECARDSDRNVRWIAFKLLQTCGTESQVEPVFVEGLSDPDKEIAFLAIRGLTRIGPPAHSAVPNLAKLLHSEDPLIVDCAEYAIWEISPDIAAEVMNWTTMESDRFGFRAKFPESPESGTSYQDLPLGQSITTRFMAKRGINVFGIAVTDFPPEVGETYTVEDRYNSIADEMPGALGGDLKRFVEIEKQGHSGTESVIEIEDRATIKAWHFIIDPRGYHLQIVRPRGGMLHLNAEAYFFNSFEFDPPPATP